MNEWTHPICDSCWQYHNGDRQPFRLVDPKVERCCWCGAATMGGIYLRQDPQTLDCQGRHE